jgi:hypothetical protein
MSEAFPGARLRPHVKAHKCTALAARQADLGHTWRSPAPPSGDGGHGRAGLGDDLLLANEVVDATRLGASCAPGRGSPWPSTPTRPSTPRVRRGARGADRRQCRPASLRLSTGGRRAGWPIVARSRGFGPRGHGVRGPHRRARGPRQRIEMLEVAMELLRSPTTMTSVARSSRPGGPAPTTSTTGPPRFRPARTP